MSQLETADRKPTALRVHQLSRLFARQRAGRFWSRQAPVRALDSISFELTRGETLCVVGESGSGKSTLARLLVGLDQPTSGNISYEDKALTAGGGHWFSSDPSRKAQLVFQDPYASLSARHTVFDILAEAVRIHRPDANRAAVKARVYELLGLVGLRQPDALKVPHQFSGGQRQRISIARALAADPDLLVCDEPTSALDVSVQAQILNLLKRLQREQHLTCVFISHNLAVVYYVADQVAVVYLGRLVELGPRDAVFNSPAHPYTRLLLRAVPKLTRSPDENLAGSGEIPSALDPPPGCSFHPRCSLATERCRSEEPRPSVNASGVMVSCHAVDEGRLPPWSPQRPSRDAV